jgi:hypothetical protein
MAERKIPDIPVYKGNDKHVASIFDKLKLAIDHMINTDFVTEKDIYCRDLITAANSIYLGEKNPKNRLSIQRSKETGDLVIVFEDKILTTEPVVEQMIIDGGMRGNAVFVSTTDPSLTEDVQTNDLWVKY